MKKIYAWFLDALREDANKGVMLYRWRLRTLKAKLAFAPSAKTQALQRKIFGVKPMLRTLENWRAHIVAERQKLGLPFKGPMALRH